MLGDFVYSIHFFFHWEVLEKTCTNEYSGNSISFFSQVGEGAVTKKESNPRKGQENRVLLRKNPKKEKRDFML